MALGLSMGDGNFTPYAKYDARAGRWFTKGADGDIDITDGFTAVFDLETVEVGWMIFASGVAPVYVVQDIALGVPPKPPGDMKQGFKMNIALPSAIAGGGVREVSSTAKSMIGVIDRLHTEYSGAPEKSQGKLPVVKMNGTTVVETKGPSGMTRNYAPNLQIVSWVARPESMPKKQVAAQMFAAAPTYAAPPSTGSTQVPPPVQQAAPAAAMDFG